MRALVISDGAAAYVLPAVRSLSRAGWTVGVGQPAPGPLTASRACSAWHAIPPAEDDVGRFLDAVAEAVRAGGYDVVFPGDDVEVLALSEHRDAVPAVVPYAAHEVVVRALDKLTLTEAAQAVGLAVPGLVPEDAAELPAPVVVKARLHWSGGDAVSRHLPVQVATTPAELAAAARVVRSGGGVPVVQEQVDGTLMAVSAVCDAEGRLRAVSQQETERTSLRRTSARARTVPLDDALVEQVRRLLVELGWSGLANLQFLRPPGGVPRLIDLNPRYYGSLALAVSAGADLPRVWADLALGRDPGPLQRARAGVRFSAFDEDVLRARRGPGATLPAAVDAVRYTVGAAHSTWDVRDPGPSALRFRQRARRVAGRVGSLRAGGARPPRR